MRFPILIPFLIVASTGFAGCLEEDGGIKDVEKTHDHDVLADLPKLETGTCVQAGGNSVYAMEEGRTKVGPFLAADQRAEIGNPMIGAFGRPVQGPQNGIWHVAVLCDSYTVNGTKQPAFRMGWIAQMIKKPDFDTSDARLHFFVADLSFGNGEFANWMRSVTGGAEVSPNTETKINLLPAEKYMHVVISEARHGTFEFTAELHKEFGKKQTEHLRFWLLVSTDGSHQHGEAGQAPTQYRPVAIDVYDTADGTGRKLAGESIGTFTHLPDGHYGNPLGHYQEKFTRRIELAPAIEGVLFNETWLH